jgi:hypothetical protein
VVASNRERVPQPFVFQALEAEGPIGSTSLLATFNSERLKLNRHPPSSVSQRSDGLPGCCLLSNSSSVAEEAISTMAPKKLL